MRASTGNGAAEAMAPGETHAHLEAFRVGLTGYCYRMLGSAFDADDAVQETLLRAWQRFDQFDRARAPLRSWLYTIATNVCLDMLRGRQRRALAMDLGPASPVGAALGAPLPQAAWLQPIPDGRTLEAGGDPADEVVGRETIRLAFVAALQHLPPRQRAVLILRDVLRWPADEVATLLDGTVAAVNSALQRARATMASARIAPADGYAPLDASQQELLGRYCDAFERYDVEALVSLLHEDATMTMPPFAWWLAGRQAIRQALLAAGAPCDGARLVPTVANGSPAFAQYRPTHGAGGYQPFALVVLDVAGGSIRDITTFLDAERLFPLFDLPTGTVVLQ